MRLGAQEQGRAVHARCRRRLSCRRRRICRRSRASIRKPARMLSVMRRTKSRSRHWHSRSRPIRSSATLAFFRVYSGVLKRGSYVYNSTKDQQERIGRIVRMHANDREEVEEIYAGEIAAIVGLKNTTTGDTLCDPDAPDHSRKDHVPRAGHRHPRSSRRRKPTRKKWAWHCTVLAEEDPTFRVAGRPRNRAKRSSPAWANCIWKSSSTA